VFIASIIRTIGAIIALAMETVSSSETSVNFYETTLRNIQEDSHLYRMKLSAHRGKLQL
jgi:hypothetical protein